MTWKKLTRDLTAYDVGKKVRLRNGGEDVIEEFDEDRNDYCVVSTCEGLYYIDGAFYKGDSNPIDIVEIYEKASDYFETYGDFVQGSFNNTLNERLQGNLANAYNELLDKTNLTISIEDGTEVVKGRFKDSSGKKWYVTMERF